jgi:uncharacterized protein (TIGR04255 family)
MPTTKSLQELIIAAHFQAPLPFTVMDLASWVEHFSDFPVVQQIPALPPATVPAPGPPQMQFQLVQDASLPRMLLRSSDNRYSVQLQNDRFGFGWHRTEPLGEAADYPGYEEYRKNWHAVLHHFESWTQKRFGQRPAHRLIEISYSNAVPLERAGQKRKISEIFTMVQLAGRVIGSFNTSWMEAVYPTGPSKGTVSTVVAVGTAPPALPVLIFNFAGIAPVAAGEQSAHILDNVHAKIRGIYESSIVPDAD